MHYSTNCKITQKLYGYIWLSYKIIHYMNSVQHPALKIKIKNTVLQIGLVPFSGKRVTENIDSSAQYPKLF